MGVGVGRIGGMYVLKRASLCGRGMLEHAQYRHSSLVGLELGFEDPPGLV